MSILGSIGGGMKVYKNKPVDEQYLLSCGWKKVDEDSDDRLVYGVNFTNIRYPNIGLVPFGYVLQKDNINAANVERRDGEDQKKTSCISDIHVMTKSSDMLSYTEIMNRDDIVAWCYISD